MSDKAAAKIGCLKQLQATAQGWVGWVLSPLTSLLSIQCFENTSTLTDINYTGT